MFSSTLRLAAAYEGLRRRLSAECDGATVDDGINSLLGDAEKRHEYESLKVKPPMQFENLGIAMRQGSVNTFDGMRVMVQKQHNLNTVVSHFYWMGAANHHSPIYQYRVILPFDDKMVNVATDLDFNVECEVKYPLAHALGAKLSFQIGQNGNNGAVDVDYLGDSYAGTLQFAHEGSPKMALSHMQALTPSLSLGGMGQYWFAKRQMVTAFGGIYDRGENFIAAQWDSQFRVAYTRKVNPNRVHVSTELSIDKEKSSMAVGVEYMLKQGKLHMSVDSDLLFRSTIESTYAQNVSLQFSAEMQQMNNHYKFGYGITIM